MTLWPDYRKDGENQRSYNIALPSTVVIWVCYSDTTWCSQATCSPDDHTGLPLGRRGKPGQHR